MNSSFWTLIGAVLGFFAVVMGAFGAHGLRASLTPESLEIFKTAAQYQMFHALVLVGLGAWLSGHENLALTRLAQVTGWSFLAGKLVFSGSLYFLAVTGVRAFGAITPIGGVLYLVGWLGFAWLAWRKQ